MNQNAFKRGENARELKGCKGVLHLWKGKRPLEFDTMKEARTIADRVGGIAYLHPVGRCYLIKFD